MKIVKENNKTIIKSEPLKKVTHDRLNIMWTEDGPDLKTLKKFCKQYKYKRMPGLLCKHCEFFIFSAHRWDFSACKCHELTGGEHYVAIDGGGDYCRYVGDVWNRTVRAELNFTTGAVYAEPYERQPIEKMGRFQNIVEGD